MAVDAHSLHPLSLPQFSSNREIMNPVEANGGFCDSQTRYAANPAFGPTSTADAALFNPMCNIVASTAAVDCFVPQIMKPEIQSVDSSVTLNGIINNNNDPLLLPVSSTMRKRSREGSFVVNPSAYSNASYVQNQKSCSNPPTLFLGHDMSQYVQQQQLDVDCLIFHYMERMKMEIEEKKKRQGRRIMEAIQQSLMKRLRAKDEEIEKIGKLNMALEEKVRSLYLENQIWRDLAQSSEATANALRTNLQQVLAVAERSRTEEEAAAALADDAQSCCGSTEEEGEDKKRVRWSGGGMCKNCDKGEASVLMLPCRHLSLCTVCGSTLHTCPVCKSVKNASVHINLSSS